MAATDWLEYFSHFIPAVGMSTFSHFQLIHPHHSFLYRPTNSHTRMEYKLPNHSDSFISDPLSVLDSDELEVSYWAFLTTLLDPIASSRVKLSHQTHRDPVFEDTTREPLTASEIYKHFTNAIETIAYSLTGSGNSDNSLLLAYWPDPLSPQLVQRIVHAALQLPTLIPEGYLPVLGRSLGAQYSGSPTIQQVVTLTTEQVACIVCHMVLGTLPKPPWATISVEEGGGFSWDGPNLSPAWFADDGRGSKEIKSAYIRVLLAYLDATLPVPHSSDTPGRRGVDCITYQIVEGNFKETRDRGEEIEMESGNELVDILTSVLSEKPEGVFSTHTLVPLRIILLEQEEDDDHEECFTVDVASTIVCQLVSANSEIGFGPAATQEERLFGAVPTLLPAVLFTPRLRPTQGLLVSGDGINVFGHFKGHLRSARLERIYPRQAEGAEGGLFHSRKGRQFLFLDALEMDGELHGRDAELPLMERELRKLVVGFNALVRQPHSDIKESCDQSRSGVMHQRGKNHVVVVLPPWGCGTFGGDFKIKLLLIWLAASMVTGTDLASAVSASLELRLAVKKAWWEALDAEWRMFLEMILKGQNIRTKAPGSNIAPSPPLPWTVGMLWTRLRAMERR